MGYYTPLITLSWLTLAILCILVKENNRLSQKDKRILYVTYAVVALSALAEWLGIRFNGNAAVPAGALRAVKFVDYVLTPVSGGIIVLQFHNRSVWRKVLLGILAANALFQFVSLFTGWMLVIDAENRYSHGSLYLIYILVYFAVLVLTVVEFAMYGRRFRRQNRFSLYGILLFSATGVIMQEASGGAARTAYISITIGMALLFIHNTEFSFQKADDRIQAQLVQITVDPLTGVSSRHAYAQALHDFDSLASLPNQLVVFSVDINGLKRANDTLGHVAGDKLICGAADCTVSALGKYGVCYRTGGDEFIVLANMEKEKVPAAVALLEKTASEWHGKETPSLSLSVGSACAADHPDATVEKLISIADREMYKSKAEYYRSAGIERRTI